MPQHDHEATIEWMRDVFPLERLANSVSVSSEQAQPKSRTHSPPIDAEMLRDWIYRITDISGVKPSQLAIEANLAASTVNRFLRETNKNVNLNASTISALEKAAIRIIQQRTGANEIGSINRLLSPDFEAENYALDEFSSNVKLIKVHGTLWLNYFWGLDTFKEFLDEDYTISVPVPRKYAKSQLCAFEINREKGNDVTLHSEIAVCVPTWSENLDYQFNERLVVAERGHNNTVSVGIRDLSKDERGNIWLLPTDRDLEKIEPSFLSRNFVSLIKANTGLAFVVVGLYQVMG